MTVKTRTNDYLSANRDRFESISRYIWEHPETRYQEFESAAFLADELEKEGFQVERGVGGIETAFVASFGQGKPVIGFLGEFDALSGLSQKANVTEQEPLVPGGVGHNPAEKSLPEDIEAGVNVLLHAVLEADRKL